ncbi:MAG: hypothetical protein E7623_04360 [Ruminococcaceae bacterium]|nr:hypothetical protein [Oscillospiraceae bacterium]
MFGFKFKKKDKGADIGRLHGKAIRYVSERAEEGDIVIGKSGSLTVKDGEILVFASSEIVFRADTGSIKASELLSGDGVILSGPDKTCGGKERTVVVYYTYYM